MKVLLDNGHGSNTPGKRSPDGKLMEYAYTREIAGLVFHGLRNEGIDAQLLVKEEIDVPLSERVRRVNEECSALGKSNVILVSLHCNAAGDGTRWMGASGWEIYTSPGKTKADRLAECIYSSASLWLPETTKFRTDFIDSDPDKESSFYILKHSKCPAVLTENLFMDNIGDCHFMLSLVGKAAIAKIHVEGIKKYIGL